MTDLELDMEWIDNYEKDYKEYNFFYLEEVISINILYLYIDEKNNLIKIKKEKIFLDNQILSQSQLIHIIKNNKVNNNTKYKLYDILKYNIILTPENIPKFLNSKEKIDFNFLSSIKTLNDIKFENTINLFQDLNTLYIIYNIPQEHNSTKKVYFNNKKRKTKRK